VVGVAVGEPVEDRGEVVALVEQLEQAGWSLGDVALRGAGGGLVWIALGRRGSDLLMVSGPTCAEAWRHTLDRASAVGRLPGWPRPAPAALPIQAKQPGMPTFFPVITTTDGPFGHGSAISATG
jgi:hypothetical protein